MPLWITGNHHVLQPSALRRALNDSMPDEHAAPDTALEIARGRKVPAFYVVDDALRVIFCTGVEGVGGGTALPDGLRRVVERMRRAADLEREPAPIGVLSPTQVVRLQRLESRHGGTHYAVFIEPFAPRNAIQRAAERYKLSAREVDVLDGLVRGEGTGQIAARLGIAATTVQEHIRKIGRKTNVTKRSAIIAMVHGLR